MVQLALLRRSNDEPIKSCTTKAMASPEFTCSCPVLRGLKHIFKSRKSIFFSQSHVYGANGNTFRHTTYSDLMTETPSLSEALTTSLSPCTSLPTRQRVRTSTGGSDDEYFDVDIVREEETLEHDIIDGDSSDVEAEGVTTTVGVSAGFMAPRQGVVAADELILALASPHESRQ